MSSLEYSKTNDKKKVFIKSQSKRIVIDDLFKKSDSENSIIDNVSLSDSDSEEQIDCKVAKVDAKNKRVKKAVKKNANSKRTVAKKTVAKKTVAKKVDAKRSDTKKSISDKNKTSSVSNKTNNSGKRNGRKLFYYKNDDAKPVSAAGVLIYKKVDNKMELLIMDSRNKYEDIGGKVDDTDEDIFHTVGREVEEETNGVIHMGDIIGRLNEISSVYIPKSKYVIFIVEATDEETEFKKEDFGDREEHDDFPRTIGWIPKDELTKPTIIKFKMNWRLKSRELFNKLKEIENNFKYNKKMF